MPWQPGVRSRWLGARRLGDWSPALDASVPAAYLTAGVGVEALPFGAGFEAHEVGGPVGRAAVHELVFVLPAFVAEEQSGATVVAGCEGVGDAGVDPVFWTVDAPPDNLVRPALDDLERSQKRLVDELSAVRRSLDRLSQTLRILLALLVALLVVAIIAAIV